MPTLPRLARLAAELEEAGLSEATRSSLTGLLLEEIDRALRPTVHERRVLSSGTIVEPTATAESWAPATGLTIIRQPVGAHLLEETRRFADGLSSWMVRRAGGADELMVFDRPAGSERDLVVLAESLGATLVQRHPSGTVRAVGRFGVLRWESFRWHHEPPVAGWLDIMAACSAPHDVEVLMALLEFAVHDLAANGIGALIVYRAVDSEGPYVEERHPTPPLLSVQQPFHLAPLRHALAQVDGAAVLDAEGRLRRLGARLVPSAPAEAEVPPYRGTRHTSARRYSYDDPGSIVVVVSEDGPVTVFRKGMVLGHSPEE